MSDNDTQQDKLDKLDQEMNDLLSQVDDVVDGLSRTLSDDKAAWGDVEEEGDPNERLAEPSDEPGHEPGNEPGDAPIASEHVSEHGDAAENNSANDSEIDPANATTNDTGGTPNAKQSSIEAALSGALESLGLDEMLPADMSDMPEGAVQELSAQEANAERAAHRESREDDNAAEAATPTEATPEPLAESQAEPASEPVADSPKAPAPETAPLPAQADDDMGFGSLDDLNDLDAELAKLADDMISQANAEADQSAAAAPIPDAPPSVLESAAAYSDESHLIESRDTLGAAAGDGQGAADRQRDDDDNPPPPSHGGGDRAPTSHAPAAAAAAKPKREHRGKKRASSPSTSRSRASQIGADIAAALLAGGRWLAARISPACMTLLVLINKPLAQRSPSLRQGIAFVASFNVLLACTIALWAIFFRSASVPVVTVNYAPRTLQGEEVPTPVADTTMDDAAG